MVVDEVLQARVFCPFVVEVSDEAQSCVEEFVTFLASGVWGVVLGSVDGLVFAGEVDGELLTGGELEEAGGTCVCVLLSRCRVEVGFDVDVGVLELFVEEILEVVMLVVSLEEVEYFGFDGLADGLEGCVLYECFPGLYVVCGGECCVMWVGVWFDVCKVF